jgi:nitroreductase
MELDQVLRTTGAVRDFTGEPVDDEVLFRVLDNARFAPSGGNRQGVHVTVVRDRATRERLVELSLPGARRYTAQGAAGEVPWNPVDPPGVDDATISATEVPDRFTEPLLTAAVVLVVTVDLGAVAATDQDLDRIAVVPGGSVYPLAWNILLAARQEGLGGTFTTMLVAEEPAVKELLRIPEQHALACVIPLGHPVKQPRRLTRREVPEFVTLETYDGTPFTTDRTNDATS